MFCTATSFFPFFSFLWYVKTQIKNKQRDWGFVLNVNMTHFHLCVVARHSGVEAQQVRLEMPSYFIWLGKFPHVNIASVRSGTFHDDLWQSIWFVLCVVKGGRQLRPVAADSLSQAGGVGGDREGTWKQDFVSWRRKLWCLGGWTHRRHLFFLRLRARTAEFRLRHRWSAAGTERLLRLTTDTFHLCPGRSVWRISGCIYFISWSRCVWFGLGVPWATLCCFGLIWPWDFLEVFGNMLLLTRFLQWHLDEFTVSLVFGIWPVWNVDLLVFFFRFLHHDRKYSSQRLINVTLDTQKKKE